MYTPTDIDQCIGKGADSFHIAFAACASVSVEHVMKCMEYPCNQLSFHDVISTPWKNLCKTGLEFKAVPDSYDWMTNSMRYASFAGMTTGGWWVAVRRGLFLDFHSKRWVTFEILQEMHGESIVFHGNIFTASIA